MFENISNIHLILFICFINLVDILTTYISLNLGFVEVNPIMKNIIVNGGWLKYIFIKNMILSILVIPGLLPLGENFFVWRSMIILGTIILVGVTSLNVIQIILVKMDKINYAYKIINIFDYKIINIRNVMILGGILILIGLTGPWLHFGSARRNYMYYFDMSPFYLIVNKDPLDLNLLPEKEFIVNYKIDATFLGITNVLGVFLVFYGIFREKMKLRRIGTSLNVFSTLLFPTVLPIIFSSTSFRWGIILAIMGTFLILISLLLEYIKIRNNLGYPSMLGRK